MMIIDGSGLLEEEELILALIVRYRRGGRAVIVSSFEGAMPMYGEWVKQCCHIIDNKSLLQSPVFTDPGSEL